MSNQTSLEIAIAQLEAEIVLFEQGTKNQPKEGTVSWFVLRARALGLSHLKRTLQLNVESDPPAAERLYRETSKFFKTLEVPVPEVVTLSPAPEAATLSPGAAA